MIFSKFCKQFATPVIVTDDLELSETPSEDVIKRVNVLCNEIMKPKMDILDKIEISFIEARLQDMEHVEDVLEHHYNGDVPDYLLHMLSTNLYGSEFNQLNLDQQAIIKTLSVYLCISMKG